MGEAGGLGEADENDGAASGEGRAGGAVAVAGAFTPAQVAAVRARAAALGYHTPSALARAVGVAHVTILRWFSGERAPAMRTQQRLARALELPWPTDFLPAPDGDAGGVDGGADGGLSSTGGGRYTAGRAGVKGVEGVEGGARRDVPVYRAGTRTDPGAPDARASAEDEVALLEADARVLGARGFGVRVVDESLSHWTVARGDVLWFDPDWPVEAAAAGGGDGGVIVAALLPCGELQARVLRGGELVTDGADAAEPVPFRPDLYRGRNVGRMKPIDRPRRVADAPPEGAGGGARFLRAGDARPEPVRP